METLGKTENRYSAIPTIRYAMKTRGLPEPEFSDSRGEFSVVLYNAEIQSNAETGYSAANDVSDEKGLLDFCSTPRTCREIIDFLNIPSEQYALRRYLDLLVQARVVLLTIPERPRGPKQKYVTAENAVCSRG